MNKIVLLILVSCSASFAQVQLEIHFNEKLRSGDIELYRYSEYITNSTEKIVDENSSSSANSKTVKLDLMQPSRLLIKDKMKSRKFYAQPGNDYKIIFDDDSIYVQSEDQINEVMASAESKITEYFKKNYEIELDGEKNKQSRTYTLLNEYKNEILELPQNSEFQKQLIKYRIAYMESATLGLIGDKKKFQKMASICIENQDVHFNNQAQLHFFQDYYDRKFRSFRLRERKYSDELTSFEVAKMETAAIPSKEIQQVVLINFITDAFNSSWLKDNSELIQLLDSLKDHGLHTHIQLASKNLLKRFSGLAIGSEVPNFKMTELSSVDMNLSDFHGKYVLLDFWFIGCAPCHRGIPYKKELNDQYGDCLNILIINPINDTEAISKYKVINDLSWTLSATDKNDQILTDLNITGYPTYYLLDPTCKILLVPAFTGSIKDQFKLIEDKLKEVCNR